MELTYIPAVAAFSGSASGALATVLTGWVTQRRRDRARLKSQTNSKREELYKNFIEEASRLYADALVKDKSEISQLVDLYALIGRMKILSSDSVIEAAEKVAQLTLKTYVAPNRAFADLPELLKEVDPFRDFSEACRRELQVDSGTHVEPCLNPLPPARNHRQALKDRRCPGGQTTSDV